MSSVKNIVIRDHKNIHGTTYNLSKIFRVSSNIHEKNSQFLLAKSSAILKYSANFLIFLLFDLGTSLSLVNYAM